MRIRIKQARPRNLNDAIQLAVELEAYNKAEKRKYARSTTIEPVDDRTASALKDFWAKLDSLHNEMRELKAQRKENSPQGRHKDSNQTSGTKKLCYFCRKPGHLCKDCRADKAQRMVNTKLTKAMPMRRRSFCGNQFQTKDVWNEHTAKKKSKFYKFISKRRIISLMYSSILRRIRLNFMAQYLGGFFSVLIQFSHFSDFQLFRPEYH
jgi:hypothetical protein